MRLSLFREQRATVHLIRGAIASARSDRANTAKGWWQTNNEALAHFRDALGVPGNDKDVGALEYKAHQLRKLGHLEGALAAYQEFENCVMVLEPSKERSVLQQEPCDIEPRSTACKTRHLLALPIGCFRQPWKRWRPMRRWSIESFWNRPK